MATNNSLSTANLLSFFLGAFLLILGIQSLVDFNSPLAGAARAMSGLFGGSGLSNVLVIVFAVLEILGGAALILSPLGIIQGGVATLFIVLVLIVWALKTVMMAFFEGKMFEPTVMVWLRDLALNVVILIAIGISRPAGK